MKCKTSTETEAITSQLSH